MALTPTQELRVFECLEITYGPGASANANVNAATIHNNFGIDTTLSEMDTLRDAVKTYINNLDPSVEAEVVALIGEWETVRLQTVTMADGAAGDISGATMDPKVRRDQIRKLMQIYVPVMDIADSLKRREGPSARSRVIFAR